MLRGCERATEGVLLAMACLTPWAFGGVRAWAEAALYLGVALVALLGAVAGMGAARPGGRGGVPALALAGLAALALAQASAWPGWLAGRLAPSPGFEAGLAPGGPVGVLGDRLPPVSPPGRALSQCPEMTLDAAARLAAGWVLFGALVGMPGGAGVSRRLGLAVAANSALLALFALVQILCGNGRMYWVADLQSSVTGGPFPDKNHLAAYLNLGLGFAVSFGLSPAGGGRKPAGRGLRLAAFYAAGLIAVGVIASLSRGGFVAMLVATSFLVLKEKPGLARTAGGLAMVAGLVAVLLVTAGVAFPSGRLATLFEPDPYLNRLVGWKAALRAWSGSPVLGVGLGTFAYSARFFEADDGCFAAHPENEYLEVLAEGGLVGLSLALLLLVAVARRGLRALAGDTDPRRHVATLGAAFGVVTLAVHGLCDFPLHIPAIAVVAVMLAAHLSRAGPAAPDIPGGGAAWSGKPGRVLAALVPVAVSLLALWHGVRMARSEAEVLADGALPPAGYAMPTPELWDAPAPRLDRARSRLEGALRHRPDWAEGHARLGIVRLSQYRTAVLEGVRGRAGDPGREAAMADPLWLHRVVHSARPDQLAAAGGVLAHEPVLRHLVPAARSFLEARRCCPVWALPHAELASLDYLLRGGDPAAAHARRALRLAGPDSPTLALAARAAAQAGDLVLAARCWRRMLAAGEANWGPVADAARGALTPDQVLESVVPDGRYAVRYISEFCGAPGDRPARDRFLRRALDRLPGDRGLSEAERLATAARALAMLGRAEPARERMTAALELEPGRSAWRNDLVGWLIGSGMLEEAHDQALVGLYYAPGDPEMRRAAEAAAEALARGSPRPAPEATR